MTREEASFILANIDRRVCDDELIEALDMAIKALEQEPTDDATLRDIFCMGCEYKEQEPCEDAISRKAVLDKKELIELEDGQSFYCISPEDVETLPPVNPQPKMGHWIYKQYGGYPECGNWHCSECDEIDNRTSAYCPNCGAKMVEPQSESEKLNCKTTKCENCQNHNYCDYEPQESEGV